MKKLIKHINIIIILAIILLVTFLIGTPLDNKNVQIIYIAIGTYTIIYYILKIIKKEKVTINKLDICVGILVVSTTIPLIFKTYVSLSGTIYNIIKFFSIYNMYLITKTECKKNPQYINIIINTIIISILILCAIGIDEITVNNLKTLKNFIDYKYVKYDEIRISSLFSYPNTMAAVTGVGIFLCAGYVLQSKSTKKKLLYTIIMLIMLIVFLLTYSRLAYIIFTLACILYLIILAKKYNIKEKINKKYIIIFGLLILIIMAYIIIGLQISDKIDINEEKQKILYSVQPNTDYKFEFDVNSKSNNENGITITLTEKNKYFDDLEKEQIQFGTFNGVKEIKIHTKETTTVMYINIQTDENSNLTINNIKLNDNKFILKYKFLPTKTIEKIQSINLNNKSVWERKTFIIDALKIVQNNWLFGYGGKAWQTLQYKTQSYNYYALEPHSFLVQVLLENGIIGLISCLGIGGFVLIKLITEIKNKSLDMVNLSIITAIIFIILHSLLDFNLSFFYVIFIIFILISILNSKEKGIEIEKSKFIYLLLIIVSVFSIYSSSIKIYFENNTDIIKVNSKRTEQKVFDTYYKLLPFDQKMKERKYKALKNAQNIDYAEIQTTSKKLLITEKYIDSNISLNNVVDYIDVVLNDSENMNKDLEFALKYISDTEMFSKYRPDFQILRLNNLEIIVEKLKSKNITEYANEFGEQLKKEIKEKEKNMLDYEKCRYEKEKLEQYKIELQKIKVTINEEQ